ncbi:MAG: hypothetical protein ACREA9_29015 [Pyrinomonadaceae bacterium]
MAVAALAPLLQFASQFGGSLFNLFRIGHADDAVDQMEDQILAQFFAPVAAKAAGGTAIPTGWVETDRLISSIDPAKSPMSGTDALALINQWDKIYQETCAQFAQQRFPCGGKPGYGGGAGRDLPRTGGLLRAKLTEIRNAKGSSLQAGFLGLGSDNTIAVVGIILALIFLSFNLSKFRK